MRHGSPGFTASSCTSATFTVTYPSSIRCVNRACGDKRSRYLSSIVTLCIRCRPHSQGLEEMLLSETLAEPRPVRIVNDGAPAPVPPTSPRVVRTLHLRIYRPAMRISVRPCFWSRPGRIVFAQNREGPFVEATRNCHHGGHRPAPTCVVDLLTGHVLMPPRTTFHDKSPPL
jgi:hypothetical protein